MDRLLLFIIPLLWASTAWSQNAFWVDPVLGSDANSGTTPAAPFQTLTFAMSMVPPSTPSSSVTIHLAPGTYSSATGEQFPIGFRPRVRVVGDAGAASTVIDGGGTASAIVAFISDSVAQPQPLDSVTGMDGVSLQNAAIGVEVSTDGAVVVPNIANLAIRGMSFAGIWVHRATGAGWLIPSVRGTSTEGSATGLLLEATGSTACNITECEFQSGAARGIDVRATGAEAISLLMFRSIVRGFQQEGIRIQSFSSGGASAIVGGCAIVQNGDAGVLAQAASTGGASVSLFESTVAANVAFGVQTINAGPLVSSIQESILAANGAGDLSAPGATVKNCCIQDGTMSGLNGNFAADPAFRSLAGGDFRLKYRSPCLDRLPAKMDIDLIGVERRVDGNLDAIGGMDIGAYEFEPLEASGTFAIATPVTFSCWGPNSATSVIAADGELLTNPLATPFGDLTIAFTNAHVIATGPATATAPTAHVVVVPNNPALSGLTFSFQSLTVSPVAAAGAAFTNAFTRTVP